MRFGRQWEWDIYYLIHTSVVAHWGYIFNVMQRLCENEAKAKLNKTKTPSLARIRKKSIQRQSGGSVPHSKLHQLITPILVPCYLLPIFLLILILLLPTPSLLRTPRGSTGSAADEIVAGVAAVLRVEVF